MPSDYLKPKKFTIFEVEKNLVGRPFIVGDPNSLLVDFFNFLEHCQSEGKIATQEMVKVVLFKGDRNYLNYKKRPEYEEVMNLIDLILADQTINSKASDSIKNLILKNKYGYSEKIESVNVNSNTLTINDEDKIRFMNELKDKYGVEVED